MILTLGRVCISDTECRRIPYGRNKLLRMHWAVMQKWNRAWKDEVWNIWRQQGRPKLELAEGQKVWVTVTFQAVQLMDEDNVHAAVKPLLDALKPSRGMLDSNPGVGLIPDDSPDKIELTVKLVKVEHRDEEKVSIELETIPAATVNLYQHEDQQGGAN